LYEAFDPDTGELLTLSDGRCKRNDCPPCARWKARRIILALHVAQPQWMLTLGPLGVPLDVCRDAVGAYRQRLRRWVSPELQDVYFVEPYRYNSGRHLHMYAWGGTLAAEAVTRAAISSDLANSDHVHVQPITHHTNLGYGLKMVTHPLTADDFTDYLLSNGGRLMHATHGFWRGPDGQPASGGYAGALQRSHGQF